MENQKRSFLDMQLQGNQESAMGVGSIGGLGGLGGLGGFGVTGSQTGTATNPSILAMGMGPDLVNPQAQTQAPPVLTQMPLDAAQIAPQAISQTQTQTQALSQSRSRLLDTLRVIGTPIGVPASLVSALVCSDGVCGKGVTLGIAFGIGYYGWTRKDILGYVLMASAASAGLVALMDSPMEVPVSYV